MKLLDSAIKVQNPTKEFVKTSIQNSNLSLIDTSFAIGSMELMESSFRTSSMRSMDVVTDTSLLIAGTWWIPGFGEVVILVGGIIIIAGTIYSATSQIGKTINRWFAAKAVEDSYEDAKGSGEETDNHTVVEGNSLPTDGDSFSSKDLDDGEGIKQRRYYDEDGNADMDIDYRHGGNGSHSFPQTHTWTNGKRSGH